MYYTSQSVMKINFNQVENSHLNICQVEKAHLLKKKVLILHLLQDFYRGHYYFSISSQALDFADFQLIFYYRRMELGN